MKVRYTCSDDYNDMEKYKSKIHEYPKGTKVDKLAFDSGVWTIDVEDEIHKEIICWSYEIVNE